MPGAAYDFGTTTGEPSDRCGPPRRAPSVVDVAEHEDEKPAEEKAPDQVWELDVDGRAHRVEASGSVKHRVRWLVDGVEVGAKASTSEKIKLSAAGQELLVVHSTMGSPRRASVGSTDLAPHPGSPAAAHEQRVLEHPTRYSALAGLGGVGKVVVPIVVTAVAAVVWRWIRPLLPDLPAIPWPDLPSLPSIPWPDLPSIPWPDLPDLPGPPRPARVAGVAARQRRLRGAGGGGPGAGPARDQQAPRPGRPTPHPWGRRRSCAMMAPWTPVPDSPPSPPTSSTSRRSSRPTTR